MGRDFLPRGSGEASGFHFCFESLFPYFYFLLSNSNHVACLDLDYCRDCYEEAVGIAASQDRGGVAGVR